MRKAYGPGGSSYFSGPFTTRSREGVDRPCVPPRRSTCTFQSHSPAFFFTLFISNTSISQRRNHAGFLYRSYKKFHGSVSKAYHRIVTPQRGRRVLRDSKWKMLIYRRYLRSYAPCYTRLLINSLLCNSITCLFSTLYYTLADSWCFSYNAQTPPSLLIPRARGISIFNLYFIAQPSVSV